jgi:hypothetical protein
MFLEQNKLNSGAYMRPKIRHNDLIVDNLYNILYVAVVLLMDYLKA